VEPREPRSFEDRPVAPRERRPVEDRRDEEPRRTEPRRDRDEEAPAFGAMPRSESGERRSEGEAEGEDRPRGRRRRGRRGGRGRGSRERRPEGREEGRDVSPAAGRSEPPDRGPREERDEFRDRDGGFDRAGNELLDEPIRSADDADREPAGERDEEGRPRRRRRRGRRGGRGRSSRERQPGEAVDSSAAPPDRIGDDREPPRRSADADDAGDEEPLPAGYGVRPAASRPAEPRSGQGGESRGRRRRGRRSGSGEGSREGSRPAAGESGGDSSRRRGRRGQRRRSDDERSTSSLSRGRRDDFAPVSRGYDEDDEGLEFLGVEEASREAGPRREPRRGDEDDVLAESGLSSVLDVPSWVEAIGIVIASNLDARSRPKSERSDDDRSRRR
jgi:hypothetical protein